MNRIVSILIIIYLFEEWVGKLFLNLMIAIECITPQIPSGNPKGPIKTYIDRINILN